MEDIEEIPIVSKNPEIIISDKRKKLLFFSFFDIRNFNFHILNIFIFFIFIFSNLLVLFFNLYFELFDYNLIALIALGIIPFTSKNLPFSSNKSIHSS